MKCQKNATENNSELAKTSPTLDHQMFSWKGKSRSGVRDTVSDDTNASAVRLHTNCYTYNFSNWKQLDLYFKNHLTWIINSETSLCFEIPSSWSLASIKGTTWLSIQAPVFFRSKRWSSPSSENWKKKKTTQREVYQLSLQLFWNFLILSTVTPAYFGKLKPYLVLKMNRQSAKEAEGS